MVIIQDGSVYVEGREEQLLETVDDFFKYLAVGTHARSVAATNMNAASSRSHAIVNLVSDTRTHLLSGGGNSML